MKLKKLVVYKYALALVKPLKMKGSYQEFRKGLIIEVTDQSGVKGYGDAAPFPGLHSASADDLLNELRNFLMSFPVLDFDYDEDIFSVLNKLPKASACLKLALDWSFADLFANAKKIPPYQLFTAKQHGKLFLNALLSGSSAEVLSAANKLKFRDYTTIKIKVATRPLAEDINLVLKLNEVFEGKLALRLDANQLWSKEDALFFCKSVKAANIEYIEEPCSDPARFIELYQETQIPYAFDETLLQRDFAKITDYKGLDAIILKPSVMGGLSNLINWIKWAAKKKVKTVFSSTFESGIGLRAIANIACAFSHKDLAHGLDTAKWLREDIIIPVLATDTPLLKLKIDKFKLNYNFAEKMIEHEF